MFDVCGDRWRRSLAAQSSQLKTMRVRTYLIALILGCCLSGLGVFIALEYLHGRFERVAAEVSRLAINLRDLDRFEASMRQWLVLSDLIFGSNETYLVDGALNVSMELRHLFESLHETLPGDINLAPIEDFLSSQHNRLEQASVTLAEDRIEMMQRMLTEMDEQVPIAVEALENLRDKVDARYRAYVQQRDGLAANHQRNVAGLLCAFFAVVLLQWFWISRMLTYPIRTLTNEAQRAIEHDATTFHFSHSGPNEVQELSHSFSNLVEDLDTQIQDHKRTQRERERLHAELVDASRRAGMAEVAAGVIHNVGNTLNSINTSVSVLSETLERSYLPRLEQAKNVLLANEDRLPQYFQEGRKGQLFPAMLGQVTDQLCKEHDVCSDELASVTKHLDHVKQIISMQQDYARPTKNNTLVCVRELVLEALEISKCRVPDERQGIEYDIAVQDQPLVTDRHKVLQVLVNLIVNASESIREHQGSGTVSLRTKIVSGFLRIEVQDSGAGISRDDLAKIFHHGFSTKPEGHGFGLHASALAAQQLGGTLSASSDGPQRGATFTLSLPHNEVEPC